MTRFRRRPANRFHAFIVEPNSDFDPTNWQQTPDHYRILEYMGPKHFRGSADAWKFLHNHEAINTGDTKRWAMFLDFDDVRFGETPQASNRMAQVKVTPDPDLIRQLIG